MTVTTEKTVRDWALEHPAVPRVFEKLGIDYCCGGDRSLEDACRAAKLSLEEVTSAVEAAKQDGSESNPTRDWQKEPLSALIDHINSTHHKFVREETVRLTALLDKVCGVHGKNHPELLEIRSTFRGLAEELAMHMMKEERVLFPYAERMEEAVMQKDPVMPPPFGTVRNPVSMMMHEHDSAGSALRALRKASNGFQAPADGCVSYRTLYAALEGFEADLHQHIHLENNILFPRAIAMERASG